MTMAAADPSVGGASTRARAAAVKPLAPASLYYVLFFALPMLGLFVLSFWRAKGFDLIPAFTLDNYAKIWASALHRTLLVRTIAIGLATSAIVVPIAFALAYAMRFVFSRWANLILQLALISLFSGYLVRIYAWRTILGKQGLLNSTLEWLGLIEAPLDFLIYSNFATIVTLTGLLVPLAVLPLYAAMANISREHLDVARDLGSRRWHLIRTILIPLAMPGIRTAFAFAFLLSAGDFVTPALVGGTSGVMIGNVIADQFRGIGSNWPLGAALAFVTMAAVLAVYFVALRLLKAVTRW
jgi:spermidine/putrescine transport system permease protein